MSDAPSEPQAVKGQWGPSAPQGTDLVHLVAMVTKIGSDVEHLTEDVRDVKRSQDQYIVEHRSQHNEDRILGRQERQEIKDSLALTITAAKHELSQEVAVTRDEKKYGRRLFIGLLVTAAGALIINILIQLVNMASKGG